MSCAVYKPGERLKPGDEYPRKPQIAAAMIRQLQNLGFRFDLVLADSLYGEAKPTVVNVLVELALPDIVAIRSHHGVWLPEDQAVFSAPWPSCSRSFSNGTPETHYQQEGMDGRRRQQRYWLLTTAPET